MATCCHITYNVKLTQVSHSWINFWLTWIKDSIQTHGHTNCVGMLGSLVWLCFMIIATATYSSWIRLRLFVFCHVPIYGWYCVLCCCLSAMPVCCGCSWLEKCMFCFVCGCLCCVVCLVQYGSAWYGLVRVVLSGVGVQWVVCLFVVAFQLCKSWKVNHYHTHTHT
jgi:hypothetical protein